MTMQIPLKRRSMKFYSQAWEQRDAFVYDIEALPASMQRV